MSFGYRLTTVFLVAVIVIAMCRIFLKLEELPPFSLNFILLGILFFVLPVVLFYLYISQLISLEVDDEVVVIKRKKGSIVVPRDEILRVEPKKGFMSDMSLWGMNGLFGYIGWYYNNYLGKFYAVANNGNKMLAITTRERCYVVSCDDQQQFIGLFN